MLPQPTQPLTCHLIPPDYPLYLLKTPAQLSHQLHSILTTLPDPLIASPTYTLTPSRHNTKKHQHNNTTTHPKVRALQCVHNSNSQTAPILPRSIHQLPPLQQTRSHCPSYHSLSHLYKFLTAPISNCTTSSPIAIIPPCRTPPNKAHLTNPLPTLHITHHSCLDPSLMQTNLVCHASPSLYLSISSATLYMTKPMQLSIVGTTKFC